MFFCGIHRKNRFLITACISVTLLLSACGTEEDTREGQPVKHRQAAFKATLRALEPAGVLLRTQQDFNASQFAEHIHAFDSVRQTPFTYFADNTNYPPSKAKDTVWSDKEGFASARQHYDDASQKLLAAIDNDETDPLTLKPLYEAVEQSCKSCHQEFRKK